MIKIEESIVINNEIIPITSNGFGDGQRCLTDKHIALIHDKFCKDIRKIINDNLDKFEYGVDLIDLKDKVSRDTLLDLAYPPEHLKNSKHYYLLSVVGYAKLMNIIDKSEYWNIFAIVIREYF